MGTGTITDQKQREKIASRVSWVGIIGNIILTAFKLAAGIIAHSGAMISDAVHSASDVFSTFVVLIGVNLGGKAPDKKHPYGHDRFECLAALVVAIVLFAAGIGIGYTGFQKILEDSDHLLPPGALALVAAAVSIVVKEAMYWYTILASRRIDSAVLKASAWDHRSDAFSSIGSFAGIFGARMGFPKMDAVASVIISIFILKVAYDILRESINKMIDCSCGDAVEQELRTAILNVDNGVILDELKTREFGDKYYVDVEISLPGQLSLNDAHRVAHSVHDTVETRFQKVKHCMVHVNPVGAAR